MVLGHLKVAYNSVLLVVDTYYNARKNASIIYLGLINTAVNECHLPKDTYFYGIYACSIHLVALYTVILLHAQGCHRGAVCQGTDEALQINTG